MTKEEAKQIIATWLVSSKGTKGQRGYIEGWFDEEDVEAFRMAIEALKAPTENTNTPIDTPTDIISREKALNLVLDVCNDVMDECETVAGICGEEVYTDVREVDAILKCNKRIRNGIRRLPSEPVGNSDTLEWIPCSERMPEKEGWYITTVESEKTGRRRIENDLFAVDIALAHGHTPNKFCKDGYRQRTVAWMPFPKPYREVE